MIEHVLSKKDIIDNTSLYETLNLLQHRHKLKKSVLYIDSGKGEILPFLGLKNDKNIDYYHLTTSVATINSNPLFKNIRNVSYLQDIKTLITSNKYDLFITDQPDAVTKYFQHVSLHGHVLLLSNVEYKMHPYLNQVFNDENIGLRCLKKIESCQEIIKFNEFASCVPVINKHDLIDKPDYLDVNVIIYMLSSHRVQIVIIRFDDETKYDDEIKIKLYSVCGNDFEYLSVKLIDTTIHKSFHDTRIVIDEDIRYHQTQRIPKIICQTLDEDIVGDIHMRTIHNLKAMNSEYVYEFFDNTSRRQFIKEHFDSSVIDTYDGFVSGAFKADVFRYCWLYINGGFYIDCKMINRIPLRDGITSDGETFVCNDRIPNAYQNCVIGTIKKNKNILNCVMECVSRFEKKINHRVSFGSLYHTGPYLFYTCMSQYQPDCKFDAPFENKDYSDSKIVLNDNRVIFNVWFKNYYKKYRNIHKKPIWSEQWANNDIYYSKKYAVENMTNVSILIYPNQIDVNISINFIYDKTSNEIYNDRMSLQCKLIDNMYNTEKMLQIKKTHII